MKLGNSFSVTGVSSLVAADVTSILNDICSSSQAFTFSALIEPALVTSGVLSRVCQFVHSTNIQSFLIC